MTLFAGYAPDPFVGATSDVLQVVNCPPIDSVVFLGTNYNLYLTEIDLNYTYDAVQEMLNIELNSYGLTYEDVLLAVQVAGTGQWYGRPVSRQAIAEQQDFQAMETYEYGSIQVEADVEITQINLLQITDYENNRRMLLKVEHEEEAQFLYPSTNTNDLYLEWRGTREGITYSGACPLSTTSGIV
ncbi:MAG: hypothetical protein AAF840_05730, partial [Bacteroidota bacterium]